MQLERIHLPLRLFVGKTNNLLHTSQPLWEIQMKKFPAMTFSVPRKVHYHSNWKFTQDAVYWIKLSRARQQGLRFQQTKSNAQSYTILCQQIASLKVICEKGDRILFERLPVDFTCLNCLSQTHFASAVGNELVDPKRRTNPYLSWRRVSCEQKLDTFQSSCQFLGNQSVSSMHL